MVDRAAQEFTGKNGIYRFPSTWEVAWAIEQVLFLRGPKCPRTGNTGPVGRPSCTCRSRFIRFAKQSPTIERLSDAELHQRHQEAIIRSIAHEPALAICVLRRFGWQVERVQNADSATHDPGTTTET